MNWNSFLAPTSATGPNGDTSSTGYDQTGRPGSSTSPYGAVTSYTYSTTGPQVTATVNGRWSQTFLDGLGRTARVSTGNGTTTVSQTDTIYDACGCTPIGKPYKTSLPYAPGATPVYTVNTYDVLGRTLSTVAPDGSSKTSYSYQGNQVTVTDPTGKWKQYTMDAYGQLVQVVEQSPDTTPNHVTTYTYDILGHLIQSTMPRTVGGTLVTQTRTWNYDPGTQLLTSVTQPETGTVTFSYNSDGTLATKTDAKSQQTQYTYDTYGELIQISRGTWIANRFTGDLTQRVTYTYGGVNSLGPGKGNYSQNTAGRVSQITYSLPHNMSGIEWYSYAAPGGVAAKRLTIGNTYQNHLDATYGYDNEGRVTSVGYPLINGSNPTYTYGYDVWAV